MELSLDHRSGVDVLNVRGAIREEDNSAFAEALEALRREGRFRLVIDARELGYVNSRGIGTLVAFVRDAQLAGGRVAMVRPGRTIAKILRSVGLLSLVPSYETADEAAAACGA
jgi:anti-anti-sigma factor